MAAVPQRRLGRPQVVHPVARRVVELHEASVSASEPLGAEFGAVKRRSLPFGERWGRRYCHVPNYHSEGFSYSSERRRDDESPGL